MYISYEKYNTVEPLLLRRLGHAKYDAIFEVDAIFEGSAIKIVQFCKTFLHISLKCDICRHSFESIEASNIAVKLYQRFLYILYKVIWLHLIEIQLNLTNFL